MWENVNMDGPKHGPEAGATATAPKKDFDVLNTPRGLMDRAGATLKLSWTEASQPEHATFWQRFLHHTDPFPVTYKIERPDQNIKWEGITVGNRKMGNKPSFDRIQFDGISARRPDGAEESRNVALRYDSQSQDIDLERGGFATDITDKDILQAIALHIEDVFKYFQAHPPAKKYKQTVEAS